MKNIKNIINLMLLSVVMIFTSCETTELDLTKNPNALTPDQADANFLLNNVQEDFARFVQGMGGTGAALTRIDYMGGRDYLNAYAPTAFNTQWRRAYQEIFQDLKVMNALTEETGLAYHTGMGQVMQAYIMLTLVDYFGDVPYTEALLGSDNLNPKADSGQSVYAAAIDILDKAIANFELTATAPEYDFFYGKDWAKWKKAANTIKMKAYMASRLVDDSALTKFNAIVTSGDYISSNADDFQFRWGKNVLQPDTRHPRYSSSYTTTGGGQYMSNSLMNYMRGDGYSSPTFDPRILYYFYRQQRRTPGIDTDPDEEVLDCGLLTAPVHYDGFVFCGVKNGWWGRDHGDDRGTPPDGFLRTLTGVYPAGGAIDDFSFKAKKNGDGDGGNGITPILLASWVDFMIAEEKFVSNDPTGAKTAFLAGIDKSISKVTTFSAPTVRFTTILDNNFSNTNAGTNGLQSLINKFKTGISQAWDDSADKMNVLGMQYFVSMYGNGIDAYNFYRRTGYPKTLQPNLEPNPGNFIRSFYYPANHANTNSNITQKENVDVKVFWDINPASPGFPSSN